MNGSLDFAGLNTSLLAQAPELLSRWLPGGHLMKREWVCGNLRGEKGESCKVNTKSGEWADFATGDKGGDLISLYAAIHRIGQGEAFKRLSVEFGFAPMAMTAGPSAPQKPVVPALLPPPPDVPTPAMIHPAFGKPTTPWAYRNSGGDLLFYIARYDPEDGKKLLWPWSWDGSRWVTKAWTEPRPLYGLDLLAKDPEKQVLVVEGEKAADAARRIAGDNFVVVTWPFGAKAWDKVDWTPLSGRSVTLWPDADEAGVNAMQGIALILHGMGCEVAILDVAGQPEGWDAADAEAEGWAGE